MPRSRKIARVKWAYKVFCDWMWKEDRAYPIAGVKPRITGPIAHLDARPPDVQHGDAGGTRLVARNLLADASGNGKEDYVIEVLMSVPEYISEIPTDLATELWSQPGGRPGLRPLREQEWKQRGQQWLPSR
jgi:hypothetical protein